MIVRDKQELFQVSCPHFPSSVLPHISLSSNFFFLITPFFFCSTMMVLRSTILGSLRDQRDQLQSVVDNTGTKKHRNRRPDDSGFTLCGNRKLVVTEELDSSLCVQDHTNLVSPFFRPNELQLHNIPSQKQKKREGELLLLLPPKNLQKPFQFHSLYPNRKTCVLCNEKTFRKGLIKQ